MDKSEENLHFFDIFPHTKGGKLLFDNPKSVFRVKRKKLLTLKGQKLRCDFKKVILLALINVSVNKFAFPCFWGSLDVE